MRFGLPCSAAVAHGLVDGVNSAADGGPATGSSRSAAEEAPNCRTPTTSAV